MKGAIFTLVFAFALLFAVTSADSPLKSFFEELPLYSETSAETLARLFEAAKILKAQRDEARAGPLKPLILIPGLVGSNLEVKLTNAKSPLLCSKDNDWETLWLNVPALARPDCFFYNLGLNYNPTTQEYSNNQGVEIDVVDFGGVKGVEYLGYIGNSPVESSEYMKPLIDSLVTSGYEIGKNLAAAPYDWRLTSNPNGWNDRIKNLIETFYTNNDNTPVFVMAHSMGNLEFTSFLNTMSSEWKEKYIGGFLSAAGPWSGASFALRALVSGIKVGLIDPFRVAEEIRSFGSIVWMLPDHYLGSEPLVVVNDTTSYNYATISELLSDIGATTSLEIYNVIRDEVPDMPNPNVPIYCLYGTNKNTELWYEYADGLDAQPTTIHYDPHGDGIVPIASLQKCNSFNPLVTHEFNLLGHSELIKDPVFFVYIMNIVNPV